MDSSDVFFDKEQTAVSGEKCPGCGDNLIFDPEKGCLKCPSCGTTKLIQSAAGEEKDFSELAAASACTWQEETHVYHCANCNAEEVLSKREIAHVCPFCGSPSVVEKEEMDTLRPNAVIPFLLNKEKASSLAREWAKKKLFAPKDFKTYFSPETINGVYIPAFTFDANTYSVYDGKLGEHYYTTHTVNGKQVRTQHTRYFKVSGNYDQFFDDLAVSATDAVPTSVTRKLLYYDYHNCVEYNEEYLYGFSALLYSRDGATCWEEAREQAEKSIRSSILSKYRYDVVSYLNVKTKYANRTYKYLLVPMYTGNYRYREKSYSFYINGRSGKAKGSFPVSRLKVSLALVIGAAVLTAAAFLLHYLGVF